MPAGISPLWSTRAEIVPTSFSATSLAMSPTTAVACAAWFNCAIVSARNRPAAWCCSTAGMWSTLFPPAAAVSTLSGWIRWGPDQDLDRARRRRRHRQPFRAPKAAGRGFSEAIAVASETKIPLIIAVPEFEFEGWTRFSNGMTVKLDCKLDKVLDWWHRVSNCGPPMRPFNVRACDCSSNAISRISTRIPRASA